VPITSDYEERVYAGVLGKIIGVYLGRPFEGWTYERIMAELGEITYYVNDRLGLPLIVTDDDISGTFTFVRALPDYDNSLDLTAQQIGESRLNYVIEDRTILWWGGFGNSSEHTVYLRLKHGIPAPRSGSEALNGPVMAGQIGTQIFIDGWAMVAPGDPELAADLARRAASVHGDGDAIFGAQVLAAMEAQAFVDSDINRLLDTGVAFIPRDSVTARLIDDVRGWHARETDWRATRELIAAHYGYDKYLGPCHIVPNHALIILGLLYGEDDFQRSLMIVNTSGWDTDCNSGNLGCLLGIKNGLRAFDGELDWRGPVGDRLYLSSADGGRAITDAVSETYYLVNVGRNLAGEPPVCPKGGARFHFELPGAVQGFHGVGELAEAVKIENVMGHSQAGRRSLAIRCAEPGRRGPLLVTSPTFIPPEAREMAGYRLYASPTLFPGQTIQARVETDDANQTPVVCRLIIRSYGTGDMLQTLHGPEAQLAPGSDAVLAWQVDTPTGEPIAEVGLEIAAVATDVVIYLDYLTWGGTPRVRLTRPEHDGTMWRRAWVDGVDLWQQRWREPYRLVQNEGTGLIMQGGREWRDYRAEARVTPHFATASGLAVRVQGMRRYYALLLSDVNRVRLVKALDGKRTLAEFDSPWSFFHGYDLALEAEGSALRGWIDGRLLFDLEDADRPLLDGGVGLVATQGCFSCDAVSVSPLYE
jgi:hypothetical protein